MRYETVFLFDVDNTLLDNDRVQADLDAHIHLEYGTTARDRYWDIFEELRNELVTRITSVHSSAIGGKKCTTHVCCASLTGWLIIHLLTGCIAARSMRCSMCSNGPQP